MISIAQHTLHVATTMWGRLTSDRLIRARAGDLRKRGTSCRLGCAREPEMVDGEKHDEAAGDDGLDWSVQLKSLQRIEFDPEDDDPLEDLFAVTFAVDGPSAEAEVEITVPDATDLEVVGVAVDTLHTALHAWADLIQRRREAARSEMPEV